MEAVFLQFIYQVGFQVNVYRPVPGECPTTLFVAAEAADQVRILNLVVKIPDESTSCQMRRGNIGNAFLFHLARSGIDHRYFPGDAASPEDLLDVFIIPLLGNKREKWRVGYGSGCFALNCFGNVLLGIAVIHQSLVLHVVILLQDFKRSGIQRNINRYGIAVFCFPGNITDTLSIAF